MNPGTVHPSPWVGAAHFPTEVNLNVNKTSSSCFISRYCRYRTERSSTTREPSSVWSPHRTFGFRKRIKFAVELSRAQELHHAVATQSTVLAPTCAGSPVPSQSTYSTHLLAPSPLHNPPPSSSRWVFPTRDFAPCPVSGASSRLRRAGAAPRLALSPGLEPPRIVPNSSGTKNSDWCSKTINV